MMEQDSGLAAIRARVEEDPYMRGQGIDLLELAPGFARVAMTVGPEQVNFQGSTHGGALFSIADAAFGAASNTHGRAAVALNVSINFLRATGVGERLVATAREEQCGHRTGLYRLAVEDGQGNMVALAEGLVYRKDTRLTAGDPGKASG